MFIVGEFFTTKRRYYINMGGRGNAATRNSNSNSLGMAGVERVLGEKEISHYSMSGETDFLNALANAELEYVDDEIKFRFFGKDKNTGRPVLMDITAYDKAQARQDIRANGYSIQRLYTTQVYDALINNTDGGKWDIANATKIDNELLKKRRI